MSNKTKKIKHINFEDMERDLQGLRRDVEDCRRDIKDCRIEIKDAIKKRRWYFVATLIVLAFLGYTSWNGLKEIQEKLLNEAEKRLEKQVADLYEEKNVARVVEGVIKNDANDLIIKKVETEVNPIMNDLKLKQQEHSEVLAAFKTDQQRYAMITLLNDLAMKAESGDLQAFKHLGELAKLPNPELSKAAISFIRRIYELYFAQTPIEYLYFNDSVPDSEVIDQLGDENFIKRKRAVYTVRKRKMYQQVPILIQRIKVEQNLDVLVSIQVTLNQLLDVKYEILQDDAQSKFEQVWEQKKDELLKTKAEAVNKQK